MVSEVFQLTRYCQRNYKPQGKEKRKRHEHRRKYEIELTPRNMIRSSSDNDNSIPSDSASREDRGMNKRPTSRWNSQHCQEFCHLVHPRAQIRYADRIAPDVTEMKKRIVHLTQLCQGQFDTRHFVYGKRREYLRRLFIQAMAELALPVSIRNATTNAIPWTTCRNTPRLAIHQLTLPLRDLTPEQASAISQQILLQQTQQSHLRTLELDGGNRLISAQIWLPILQGLGDTPRLERLTLRGIVLCQERTPLVVLETLGQSLTRWSSTLRELCLVDCLPLMYRLASQALGYVFLAPSPIMICLQSITIQCTMMDAQTGEAMAFLLLSVPQLRSVVFSDYCDLGLLLPFLPATLPWKSIQFGQHAQNNTVQDLIDLLQRANRLKDFQVCLPPNVTHDDLHAWSYTLSNHTSLQSLTVYGVSGSHHHHETSLEWIQACSRPSHLRHLCCRGFLGNDVILSNVTGHLSRLESLELCYTSRQDWFRIWQIMAINRTVKNIVLVRHETSQIPFALFDNDALHDEPFRRTLASNTALQSLVLSGTDQDNSGALDVLADALGSNQCCLQDLVLNDLRNDLGLLWEALPKNTKLSNLTLGFSYHGFAAQAWKSIVAMMVKLVHIKSLNIDVASSGIANKGLDLDNFAMAFETNPHLLSVRVLRGGDCQPKFDVVGRLYGRRNAIKRMVHQGKMPLSLWPCVLESLTPNPSAIFLVAKHIPFRSSINNGLEMLHQDDSQMVDADICNNGVPPMTFQNSR